MWCIVCWKHYLNNTPLHHSRVNTVGFHICPYLSICQQVEFLARWWGKGPIREVIFGRIIAWYIFVHFYLVALLIICFDLVLSVLTVAYWFVHLYYARLSVSRWVSRTTHQNHRIEVGIILLISNENESISSHLFVLPLYSISIILLYRLISSFSI